MGRMLIALPTSQPAQILNITVEQQGDTESVDCDVQHIG
jgi:hypothetical protein